MSDEDIKRLRQLAAAATPGPWRVVPRGEAPECVAVVNDQEVAPMESATLMHWMADARYIAAASPDVLLALLDRLEAAESARGACRDR